MNNPRVSIIIPCRNEREHIASCLASTLSQQEPDGGFEVIVADGMSDDGTREILEKLARPRGDADEPLTAGRREPGAPSTPAAGSTFRLIDNPQQLVSTALNAAIGVARGSIIVRMDAHTEYAPDYVRRCVEALDHTEADNVGGPARTRADSFLGRAIAAAYHSPFAVGGARFHQVNFEGDVDTVTYGCWRKQSFERFGLFDEGLVRNQDDEHNLRIVRGGGRVYQTPKIQSWYRPRSSLPSLFTQYMQYGYWKVRVIQKHRLPASWRHLVPAAFLLALITLAAFALLGWVTPGPLTRNSFAAGSLAGFCGMLGAYALSVLGASALTSIRTERSLFAVLPLVFPCYHFGYGLGFLRGIWDFVILRRFHSTSFSSLTRATE